MTIVSSRLVGKCALSINNCLTRDKSFHYLKRIKNIPFLSEDEIKLIQLGSLKRLIDHCYENVSFYKNWMQSQGLHPEDIRSVSDIKKFPILTKNIIRDHRDDLIAKNYHNNLIRSSTGGSTGEPLNFFRNKEYIQLGSAGIWRSMQLCGWKPGEIIAYFWGGSEEYYRKSNIYLLFRSLLNRLPQFDPYNASKDEFNKWVILFKKLQPKVILGYASTIYQFAKFLKQHNIEIPRLKGVISTAEKMYPHYRDIITKVFNCRVFDLYGCCEVLNIAFECVEGRLHVNQDYVLIEESNRKLDLSGELESREFIFTSLHNYAMPLLRYKNGDCGRLLQEKCRCGINFPLLDLNISRSCDIFTLPNGRQVHGAYFTSLLFGVEGIRNFQFIQKKQDLIELIIVKDTGYNDKTWNDLKKAEKQVKKVGGESVNLSVMFVEHIPLTRQGKHRYTISDVN